MSPTAAYILLYAASNAALSRLVASLSRMAFMGLVGAMFFGGIILPMVDMAFTGLIFKGPANHAPGDGVGEIFVWLLASIPVVLIGMVATIGTTR